MASRAPLATLAWIFMRIASMTFGSGNTTSALLGDELIDRRGWLGRAQFSLSFAIARVTPGTNLLAFCMAAGWWIRGWPGAIAALLSVAVPSALAVIGLTLAYDRWNAHPLGAAIVNGAMPAIVGVIAAGSWFLARPHLNRREWLRTALLIGGAIVLAVYDWSPLQVLLVAGIVGYFWQP